LVVGHELIVRPKNEMFCNCRRNKMRLPWKQGNGAVSV